MIEASIHLALLTLLIGVAIAITRIRNLLAVVMLSGVYSLLSASFFVAMDAVDVALTEAAVGAGISTILMVATIAITGRDDRAPSSRSIFPLALVLFTGGLLIYGTLDMPYFGSADSPTNTHVSPRYIHESMKEIGVPNAVTSVLASYRGFDTFGEVVVIFIAALGVGAVLGVRKSERNPKNQNPSFIGMMHELHLIIRIISKILIPFILLFALYVQFHGDFGPGGGFQAGVIFAAAIILYTMLFGMETARRVVTHSFVQVFSAVGVLIYGSVGLASLLNGGTFLDYSVLLANPLAGQHLGIFLIELGVGCTVTCAMIIIFFNYTNRFEYQREKEEGRDQ